MTPLQSRRLRLHRVREASDVAWLAETLTRAGIPFGTRVAVGPDDTLRLSCGTAAS